jgi:hypothetical protein
MESQRIDVQGPAEKGSHSKRKGWARRVYFVGDKKEATDGELLEH